MDMVVKVAMEWQKHHLGLDCKECMDMVVMECLKHQVGLDSNKGMDMVVKVARECK